METDTRRVHLVDAFTDEPLSGNVAGVVPDAEGLSDDQLRAIAAELGASETAFLFPSEAADRRIRYVTPTREVDLCGHATIASHGLLLATGELDPGTHSLETNVGVLEIEARNDGTVWMEQDEPSVRRVDAEYGRLADALGIDRAALADVGDELPVAVASTGLAFLIVPVAFLESLGDASPDPAAIEELSAAFDVTGTYAFTFDTLASDSTLHARMFAPAAGVPEDPVTGTASGACGAYLRHVGAFDGDVPAEMRFEQGHFLDRGGIVRVRTGDGVRVGGRAVQSLEGTIAVPDLGDDEIIEV
ncbi:MAG: PhzF family phenazine biosynthesis protein [Haloferacaceae archaeon]